MTRLDLGPIGISLNVSTDESYLDEAAELESLGYSAIWLPGGQLDSLDRIAQLVRATTAVHVVPGIIPADVYGPEAVAALYTELEHAAPGRFVVGLGGTQQPRSLQALNDYLDRLDEADPPVPTARRILAALGPRKLELARNRFAGAVTLLVPPEYTSAARQSLGVDSTLVVDQMGFTDDDVADVSDRLVDELVYWGDADTIATRVREQLDAGADHVVLGVLNQGDQAAPIEVARQLAFLITSPG